MTCAMKREASTWYLPSHLVPAKILCSRCEPCTKETFSFFSLFCLTIFGLFFFNPVLKNDLVLQVLRIHVRHNDLNDLLQGRFLSNGQSQKPSVYLPV